MNKKEVCVGFVKGHQAKDMVCRALFNEMGKLDVAAIAVSYEDTVAIYKLKAKEKDGRKLTKLRQIAVINFVCGMLSALISVNITSSVPQGDCHGL